MSVAPTKGRLAKPRFAVPWKPIRAVAFYLGLLGVWQVIYLAEFWPPYVFPGPVHTIAALPGRDTMPS